MVKSISLRQCCLFLVLMGITFPLHLLHAQDKSLRDPKEVTINNLSLDGFLKANQTSIIQALGDMVDEFDLEAIILQVDYHLKQEGYHRDFLREEDLSHIDLSKSDLRFLNLDETNFTGCNLAKANLSWSILSESIMVETDLTGAKLLDCDLKEANLTRAKLVKADLTRSNLKEVTIEATDFSGAVLISVDMSEAEGLTPGQLLNAKSLYNTKLQPSVEEEIRSQKPKLFK